MKIKYLMILIICTTVRISWSEPVSVYNYPFQENSQIYLFGDNVRVRKDPEIKTDNVIDTLNIGDKIMITSKTDKTMVIDGYKENWYKINYRKNNKDASGYIWGGLFSIGFSIKGEKKFLTGIKSFNPNNGFTAECRLVEKGKILSAAAFIPHYLSIESDEGVYDYSVTSELKGGMGLEGIENTVKIFFNYEACGYPRGNVWIGYGKDSLYYITRDTSVSEAGVFQVEEKLIFPADKKAEKNTVILVSESFEFNESINDYKLSEKKETKFIWKNFKLYELK